MEGFSGNHREKRSASFVKEGDREQGAVRDSQEITERFEYNTLRSPLRYPHVGRIFFRLAEEAVRVGEDDEARAKLCAALIESVLRAQNRQGGRIPEERYQEMWSVLLSGLGGALRVAPWALPIRGEESQDGETPVRMAYPQSEEGVDHGLGRIVYRWIRAIEEVEDAGRRTIYATALANFLKFQIRKWQGRPANEETLEEYMRMLSRGTLKPDFRIRIPKSADRNQR